MLKIKRLFLRLFSLGVALDIFFIEIKEKHTIIGIAVQKIDIKFYTRIPNVNSSFYSALI